jgi:hypothetical protein
VTGATEWHINADEVPAARLQRRRPRRPRRVAVRARVGRPAALRRRPVPLQRPRPGRRRPGPRPDRPGPGLGRPGDGTELRDRSADLVATFDEPLGAGSTATLTGPVRAERVSVTVEGSTLVVDPARKLRGRPGTYTLTFEVATSAGNASTTTSTFVVRPGSGPHSAPRPPARRRPRPRNTRTAGALCCA